MAAKWHECESLDKTFDIAITPDIVQLELTIVDNAQSKLIKFKKSCNGKSERFIEIS